MKNSLKVHNEPILEQVWNIFSEASSNVSQISFEACSVADTLSDSAVGILIFGAQAAFFSREPPGPSVMGGNNRCLTERVPHCAQKASNPPV